MATLPVFYAEGVLGDNVIYRTARKPHTCRGDGAGRAHAKHADGCTPTIERGSGYVEYVGEVPSYQSGSAHCLSCALAFGFIIKVRQGEREQ